MSTQIQIEEEIKNYISNFLDGKSASAGWPCIRALQEEFGIDAATAYMYVSRFLSKQWEVK